MEKLYREYFIIIIFVNQNKDDGMGKALLVRIKSDNPLRRILKKQKISEISSFTSLYGV